MTVSYGFYNSVAGDRKYNASQMSELFEGIITDGILSAVGTSLAVVPGTGMQVKVGVGRAWFNNTWTRNDSELNLSVDVSEIGFDRIDVVILEVDSSEEVRANSIKIVKGEPSLTPSAPTLTNNATKHQYPLAHVYIAAGVTEILEENITSKIGTDDCPIAGGILETLNTQAWKDDYNTLLNAVNAVADQINAKEEADVGNIFYTESETAPEGSMEADGSAVSRTTYARLFAKIGTRHGAGNGTTTFNLPDGRGTVPRGLDNGKGYDPDRVLGSYQADGNKAHGHPGSTADANGGHNHQTFAGCPTWGGTSSSNVQRTWFTPTPNVLVTQNGAIESSGSYQQTSTAATHPHNLSIANSGNTETTMKNTAWLCCIKY